MQDRQPGKPGQYKATLTAAEFQKMQAGQQFTITMIRDDQPIVEGTPYSKAAVLPDVVANAICPNVNNPTPADAFRALYSKTTSVSVDSVFNITGNGWWITNGDTPDGNWWLCHALYTNSGNRIEVNAYSVSGNRRARISKNTTWGEWEWKDPPMMPSEEYRTTERHNGKVVYRQLVVQEYTSDLEGLTALDIVHRTGFDELVWVNGIAHCSDGKEVPFQPAYVTSGVTGSFRVSKSSGTWSAPTIKIEMAYTKTT